MKKTYLALAAALAALSVNAALAQRKNTTVHDVAPINIASEPASVVPDALKNRCGCVADDAACLKKCPNKAAKHSYDARKADKKLNKKMAEAKEEINESYAKALKKIKQSSFSADQKALLNKQAEQTRDLALEQMQARFNLMQEQLHQQHDMNFAPMMDNKDNRKAVKRVMKIGVDD